MYHVRRDATRAGHVRAEDRQVKTLVCSVSPCVNVLLYLQLSEFILEILVTMATLRSCVECSQDMDQYRTFGLPISRLALLSSSTRR